MSAESVVDALGRPVGSSGLPLWLWLSLYVLVPLAAWVSAREWKARRAALKRNLSETAHHHKHLVASCIDEEKKTSSNASIVEKGDTLLLTVHAHPGRRTSEHIFKTWDELEKYLADHTVFRLGDFK